MADYSKYTSQQVSDMYANDPTYKYLSEGTKRLMEKAGTTVYDEFGAISPNSQLSLISTVKSALTNTLGRVPSIPELESFINNNLDIPTLANIIKGNVDSGYISNLADQYFQNSKATQNAGVDQSAFTAEAQAQAKQQQDYLDQLQAQQEQSATQTLKGQFGEEMGRQNKEAAAAGNLFQPNRQENVNRASDKFMQSLGQTIGQIRGAGLGAKAQGQADLLSRLQNQSQFGQNLGLQGQQVDLSRRLGIGGLNLQNRSFSQGVNEFNIGQKNEQTNRDLAWRLGQAQAEANKPGILDYVNTAIGGVGALAGGAGAVLSGIGAMKGNKKTIF
jgi:hypothetical protein